MEYKASLDTFCKIITVVTTIIFIAIGQRSVREIIAANGELMPILVHGGILLLFVGFLVGGYLYSTNSYSVTNDEFIIHRPIGDRVIKLSEIAEIRPVDEAEFSGTIRTFGNGGFFGYYGKYYNSKIGNMTWYVTQKRNRVLVQIKQGDKIIISPDDIGLVEKVKAGM